MEYHADMAHLRICMELAGKLRNAPPLQPSLTLCLCILVTTRYALAVVYDEVCRKDWAERAARGATAL